MNLAAADRKLSDIPYEDRQEVLDGVTDRLADIAVDEQDRDDLMVSIREMHLAFLPRND